MENFVFATLRLGKTSVSDIKTLNSLPSGVLNDAYDISVTCTQVPMDLPVGAYTFIWLGSDNSKGIPTEWKQGFKALGQISSVNRGEKYNDESTTNLSIKYIFPEAINRLDILRDASEEYYWCSSLPIIGLDDHSNQTIRMLSGGTERSDVGAFFCALNAVQPTFKNEVLRIESGFASLFEFQKPSDDKSSSDLDEYIRAAIQLQQYAEEFGVTFSASGEEIESALKDFQTRFSPEALQKLSGEELLQHIFYTAGDNTNSLCCWLEMNKECRSLFGSIAGGSAYKFGLFQKKETGVWITGSPQKPQELSETEALDLGVSIRDSLVKGATLIKTASLNTVADYEKLATDLRATVGEQYYNWSWFHKYFSLICPDKLSGFHSNDWQYHILRALKIRPSDEFYVRSGQIAMVQKYAKWSYRHFFDVVNAEFGEPRVFIRLGSTDSTNSYAAEWSKRGVVGIGWHDLGPLTDYIKGENIDRKEVQEKLKSIYYPTDERTASRKAGEITSFYKCGSNTIFVIMDGEKLLALADKVGGYFFDKNSMMAHLKSATWSFPFIDGEKLPEKSEGKMTSCYVLSKEENLLFLYDKYYFGEDHGNHLSDCTPEKADRTMEFIPLNYKTDYPTDFERNRIIFGAPGTGKSYKIKADCEDLLNGTSGNYERVTFHPDYTYSQFVGTYKPVTDTDGNIKYTFVPGPFMRVFVAAVKSGRTKNAQPYVLIIEEINRAKVAAVFGDVFQLLDRDDDGVSEYDIHASEDIKNYLAKELGGTAENYGTIKIPDNMFIWATMNSADQGVYPMDTAFKRRWAFEYLGINANESHIHGSITLGSAVIQNVEWNLLRRAINDKLAKEYKVNEDKLMGPFFLSKKVLKTVSDTDMTIANPEMFTRTFKSKVIMYLYEDAAKQYKHKLFSGCEDTTKYSAVCDSFDKIGIQIFGDDFEEVYYNPQKG